MLFAGFLFPNVFLLTRSAWEALNRTCWSRTGKDATFGQLSTVIGSARPIPPAGHYFPVHPLSFCVSSQSSPGFLPVSQPFGKLWSFVSGEFTFFWLPHLSSASSVMHYCDKAKFDQPSVSTSLALSMAREVSIWWPLGCNRRKQVCPLFCLRISM